MSDARRPRRLHRLAHLRRRAAWWDSPRCASFRWMRHIHGGVRRGGLRAAFRRLAAAASGRTCPRHGSGRFCNQGGRRMITLANRVRSLLASAGAPVWYFYPQSWVRLPVIAWRESGNREFAQADGGEHLAELEYTVDIWSDSPAKNAELASAGRRRDGLGAAAARLFGRSVRAVHGLASPLGALSLRGRRGGQHLSVDEREEWTWQRAHRERRSNSRPRAARR